MNQSRTQTDSRLDTALLLAVEAYRRNPSPETQGGLLTALNAARHLTGFRGELPADVSHSAVSADGRTLAVLTISGELLRYDTTNWSAAPTTVVRDIDSPSFVDVSPDGRRAVFGAADGAHFVDLDGGRPGPAVAGSTSAFVSFSADGRFVVLESFLPPGLALLDAGSGAVVHEYPASESTRGLTRPHRDELVVGEVTGEFGTTTTLRRLGLDGAPLGGPVEQTWQGPAEWAYTPGGEQLIVGAADGSLHLVDADTLRSVGTPLAAVGGFGAFPVSLALSPSGVSVAISHSDGSVRVVGIASDSLFELYRTARLPGGAALVHWLDDDRFLSVTPSSAAAFDLRDATPLAKRLGHHPRTAYVQAATGSPDGHGVVYVFDGRLDRMSASGETGSLDVTLPIDPMSLANLVVSPDGSWAAVLGVDPGQEQDDPTEEVAVNLSTVSLESGEQRVVRRFLASTESMALAIAPDNESLAFVSGDNEVSQIDATSGEQRGEPVQVSDFVSALQYSPDGRLLFVFELSGAVSSWDVDSGELEAVPDDGLRDALVTRITLTPRGDRLVAASADGSIIFADPRTARPIGSPIQAGSTQLTGVAVSRDGAQLAALDIEGSLYLWKLDTRRALGPPLRTDSSGVADPVFLSGDRQIVTASFDGFLSWDLNPDAWKETACALAGRDLSREEWSAFLPGEPYRATCSGN